MTKSNLAQLQRTSQEGATVTVDISSVKLTDQQSQALTKLLQGGSTSSLQADELEYLKLAKVQLQGGNAQPQTIVRFDVTWFNFD
jgi:hypothetical protein